MATAKKTIEEKGIVTIENGVFDYTQERDSEIDYNVLHENELQALEAHAAQLAKKHGVSKVHIYVAIDPETKERIVGFYKEPSYIQKIYAMDKIATVGMFTAGEELRSALVLKDVGESDPRVYTVDDYKLSMASACITLIQVAQNAFKKK